MGRTCLLWWLVACLPGIASAEPIRVVTEEYPPFNYTEGNGQITGVSTDIVREALRRARLDYRIESNAWARSYQIALAEPDVLIYTIYRTPERGPLFKWVGSILEARDLVYRLATRTDIKVEKLADLRRYRVGAVEGDQRSLNLRKAGIRPELATSNEMNLKKLLAGRIDVFPIEKWSLVALSRQMHLNPSLFVPVLSLKEKPVPLYMAFSLSTDDAVVERVRTALDAMRKDGTLQRLQHHYLHALP